MHLSNTVRDKIEICFDAVNTVMGKPYVAGGCQ
jgi:hypothetical protein